MAYDRDTIGAAVVAFFKTLEIDEYQAGGGHGWRFGQPIPKKLDCSGAINVVWAETTHGLVVWDGTSESQWTLAQDRGLTVPNAEPLVPGDTLALRGGGSYPPPGHTGTVVTFNPKTNGGTYISAYDTAEGVAVHTYQRGDSQFMGAYRLANLLPAPTPPPPVPVKPSPPAAHQYAAAHGMVVIDVAEAKLAIHAGISYYVWRTGMVGSRSATIPTGVQLFAFKANLDAAHISHAGA